MRAVRPNAAVVAELEKSMPVWLSLMPEMVVVPKVTDAFEPTKSMPGN